MNTRGTAVETEARRLRAAGLLQDGMASAEVGAGQSSVRHGKSALARDGIEALAAKPHRGTTLKLDDAKARLEKILVTGPLASGYATDLWACRRVAEVVQKTFGVSYHPDHLGRILHDLGFSPQKPEQLARERDEAAIARWRKRAWPRIKMGWPAHRSAANKVQRAGYRDLRFEWLLAYATVLKAYTTQPGPSIVPSFNVAAVR